ncbi:Mobile element protein [Carbonactinospora thermoautotrophica]|uniref:Mobile element protein n=1 Tax=Carbonactinospora thermoautotrophica TaxID=1469144 RepID=A0A132MYP1_9ACTN|nr:Mobile element protein [Carbonactinospora thermoautotrophica]
MLVDVEARRPVEVLADRSAESFTRWLGARPGVAVVCRDRAGCYAEGAARGPRQRSRSPTAGICGATPAKPSRGPSASTAPASASRPDRAGQHRPTNRPGHPVDAASVPAPEGRVATRTRERHAAVHGLLADGHSLQAIARTLRLARGTARRFARADSPDELLTKDGTGRRPSMLEEFTPSPYWRWNAGCTDAARLREEIQAPGYRGSYATARDHLRPSPLRHDRTRARPGAADGAPGGRVDHTQPPHPGSRRGTPAQGTPAQGHPGPMPTPEHRPRARARLRAHDAPAARRPPHRLDGHRPRRGPSRTALLRHRPTARGSTSLEIQ